MALLACIGLCACGPFRSLPREAALVPGDEHPLLVMDFTEPLPLDPLPAGWHHRTFFGVDPMEIESVERDGRHALRLATQAGGSMLFRFVDVPLAEYPVLHWQWLIEQPVVTNIDERTVAGDDHPARIYLRFADAEGEEHALELIWGNRHLAAGDWLHLGFLFGLVEFPHYVVNGGEAQARRWHRERVDLSDLYRTLWGEPNGVRITDVALFCDTDQTDTESIAYFADLRLARE